MVVLGTGEERYHRWLEAEAPKYKGKLGVKIAYDNQLAHLIEAGADMFLMPSRYEPCGLNQIYSMKYGTIPVVRATGGLADTITPVGDPRRRAPASSSPTTAPRPSGRPSIPPWRPTPRRTSGPASCRTP